MWSNAVARRFRDRVMVMILVTASAAISVGCDNRETLLLIEQPTEGHSIDPTPDAQGASVQPGHVIAILKVGETARAIGAYHGKEYDAFHVKLADGTEGLVIAGDTFKVVSR